LNKHYPDGDYLAVYESGFSGFSTYYALEAVGIACMVIHAADVPTSQYDEVMKTDKVDATKLVKSLKSGLLKGIYIHKKDDLDARAVVRLRKTIQKQLGGYKSRVKHLLYNNGVQLPEKYSKLGTCWSRAFIKWLKEDMVLLSSTRDSLDLLIDQVESIRNVLLNATRKVRNLSNTERYRTNIELLTSIPGLGVNVAMRLLTEI
jgi:transposase